MVLTGLKAGGTLRGMFERFTAKARHVVVLAQEEARMFNHNYIGTEHILLGLLHEGEGLAGQVLAGEFKLTLDGIRQEVVDIVGTGKKPQSGHIPFTPRAKKVLELALREALQLQHSYIGTEHILLGVIREGQGVAAQVLAQHADLMKIRMAVIDEVPAGGEPGTPQRRRWLRRRAVVFSEREGASAPGEPPTPSGLSVEENLTVTPAADTTLSSAANLAGGEPVGSHHLLLAALLDANSAAAQVLASLGVDLNRAKDALRDADVTGTSDEQPEDAGRRQMNVQVTGELVTIVAADPELVKAANAAVKALGTDGAPGGVIRGATLKGQPAAGLAKAWQALHDTLTAIAVREQAQPPAAEEAAEEPDVDPDAGDTAAG